ncbi:ferritin-like domain-containing protein [Sphingomonas donggukensis]|uniref:Ferritin-like domain-containing protein n=1 Tax=Sphingomonas donggukensis TaxID=2949093 RepID=A0ABY4TSF4_9SPHN|nr:ferritin-like domain-containing protein [Sphingomonas donggukensis]URW74656.1 ferritin-like domain-containing protein [Sphingomonas donggukensis]
MEQHQINEILAACDKRRDERRSFLRAAGGATAAVAGAGLLAACDKTYPTPAPFPTPTPSPTSSATTDADVLNFALNLEYLEAQFYSYAAFGVGLNSNLLTGTGAQGPVAGGSRVPFSDPLVANYAREIARDEIAHVAFLRSALGSSAVAQPAIDISVSPTSAFSNAARAAGLITASTDSFNPYASDENFLLGAFIFEDVGVTAYKGASVLITNKTFLEAAAGILAAEAYHAGLVRTVLYRKGLTTPSLISATESISNARDSLDGGSDLDQGVAPSGSGASLKSNIVPTDGSSVAYSRSAGQVLNIVYLNKAAATGGGFFPSGVNGTIRTSAASG